MGFVAPGRRFRRKIGGRRPSRFELFFPRTLAVPIDPRKIRRARTSRQPNEASDSTLERLPHDILWEIFLLAGLENNLPLLSKYFSEVLKAPRLTNEHLDHGENQWLFLKILDLCLVHNLNSRVKEGWVERFSSATEGYDTSREPIQSIAVVLLGELSNVLNEPYAMDVNTFNRRFMNETAFKLVRERYPRIQVMTNEEIASQIEHREALLSWKYNVLVEALKKAKDADENVTPNDFIEQAMKEKDIKAQEEGLPILLLTPSLKLPTNLFNNLTHSKALMMNDLVEYCRCEFDNEVPYLRACFERLPYELFPIYAKLGGKQASYTVDDFKLVVECIVTAEKAADHDPLGDDTLKSLYSLAERSLESCPIKDHETLEELAWLTLEVKLRSLRQLLSAKSIESLGDM